MTHTPGGHAGSLRRGAIPQRVLDGLVALDDHPRPVVVACSGGADSTALLAVICSLGLRCTAVYVDHGLRPGTERERDLVADLASRWAADFEHATVSVDASSASVEAAAREARYEALESVRRRVGAVAVLVGHTADDQAETVLLDLLRGGGVAALSGMPPVRGAIRRPLLGLRRRDTHEVCARVGVSPIEDAMNSDTAYRRVWVRRRVLPELQAAADRDLVPLLARQAALAADDRAVLDELATARLDAAGDPPNAEVLAAPPDAIARRAVRLWLGPPWPDAADVERVVQVAKGLHPRTEVSGGRVVERCSGALVALERVRAVPASTRVSLPGVAPIGSSLLRGWIEHAPPVAWPDGRSTCVMDLDRVGREVELRAARLGDRIQPLGLDGSRSVRSVLAEIGVPSTRRAAHPLVASTGCGSVPTGEPVWVVGYRVDERVRVNSRTSRYLWLTAEPYH